MLIDRINHMTRTVDYRADFGDLSPVDVLRRNFWFATFSDQSTLPLRHLAGVDHIMVETDYPHSDSTWPETQDLLHEQLRIDPDHADALVDGLQRLEREMGVTAGRTTFQGKRSRRVHNLVGCSSGFRDLAVHPATLPFIDALLGADALLTIMVSLNLGPGQRAQILHCDDGIYPVARPHPPMDVQVLFALTDFTEANGATRVVPGSHRSDHMPPRDHPTATRAAAMPKGSALVYHGSLWHGAGANTTDRRRIGLAVQYCAGYLRPQENWFLLIPRDEVATYPERLQTLLGWGMYRKLLGHIDERDPKVLLGRDLPVELIYDLVDRGQAG